jgi:hypothetical protein
MVDPKMTRFKAMSLDEQVTTMEHLAQGALRAKEERITSEVAKASFISPTQGRDIHLA